MAYNARMNKHHDSDRLQGSSSGLGKSVPPTALTPLTSLPIPCQGLPSSTGAWHASGNLVYFCETGRSQVIAHFGPLGEVAMAPSYPADAFEASDMTWSDDRAAIAAATAGAMNAVAAHRATIDRLEVREMALAAKLRVAAEALRRSPSADYAEALAAELDLAQAD